MICAACGCLLSKHAALEVWRCVNLECPEFDRAKVKRAATVATEKTDASPSCRPPLLDEESRVQGCGAE